MSITSQPRNNLQQISHESLAEWRCPRQQMTDTDLCFQRLSFYHSLYGSILEAPFSTFPPESRAGPSLNIVRWRGEKTDTSSGCCPAAISSGFPGSSWFAGHKHSWTHWVRSKRALLFPYQGSEQSSADLQNITRVTHTVRSRSFWG